MTKKKRMVNGTDSKKEAFIREIELELRYVSNNELTEQQEDDSYQSLMNQLDLIYKDGGLVDDLGLVEFRIALDIIDEIKMTYAEAMIAAINFLSTGILPVDTEGEEDVEKFVDSSSE